MQTSAQATPLSVLLRRAVEQAARLLGLEIESAKLEITGKLRAAGAALAVLALALVFAALAAVALTVCAVLALSLVVAPWLAALIVTLVWLMVGAALAVVARGLLGKALPPLPIKTLQNAKEDLTWAKARATSVRTSSSPFPH